MCRIIIYMPKFKLTGWLTHVYKLITYVPISDPRGPYILLMKVLNLKPYKNNYSYSFILLKLDFSGDNGRCTKVQKSVPMISDSCCWFLLCTDVYHLHHVDRWTDLNLKCQVWKLYFRILKVLFINPFINIWPNQNTEWKMLDPFGSLRVWEQSEFKVKTYSRTQYECLVLIALASEPIPTVWLLRWLLLRRD